MFNNYISTLYFDVYLYVVGIILNVRAYYGYSYSSITFIIKYINTQCNDNNYSVQRGRIKIYIEGTYYILYDILRLYYKPTLIRV